MVNGFTACDFLARVRIDIRVCRFSDWQTGRCKTDRAVSDLRLAIQKPDIKKSTWAGAKIEKKNDINTQD
jgi:hypothetical protein